MARAKRHFIPGYVWHITHRCYKRDFLLKLVKDRKRWLNWIFQAKKKYGLHVLDYILTSNHIHLLVIDEGGRDVIPNSLKLAAGRVGQEYNIRKNRKGAFWEDRYHATAIQTDEHLIQCLVYIDLNMVRSVVVSHPSEWAHSGYNEIRKPKERYSIIDVTRLMKLLQINSSEELRTAHYNWVEETLKQNENKRDSKWTESIGVGRKSFLKIIKE
ncbi:MAG: transposase, partial [Bacteroidetes bacterium]|nr:transposase [Bacteroidota bacterium]